MPSIVTKNTTQKEIEKKWSWPFTTVRKSP